jgi:hypothetical protein
MKSLNASDDAFGRLGADDNVGAFGLVKRLLQDAKQRIEDIQSHKGIIETTTTVYKVVESDSYSEALIGDLAVAAARAYSLQKNYVAYVPEAPQDFEQRLIALGLAEYFSYRGLNAHIATSSMQISRLIFARSVPEGSPVATDAFYWRQVLQTIGWLSASIIIYSYLRHQPFFDVFVILPLWFRAFYGFRFPNAVLNFRDPRSRLVEANSVVAPILTVFLVTAIALAPMTIAPLGAIAIGVDIAAFTSTNIARFVSKNGKWVPRFLR